MNFKEWFGKGEHFYYMESDHRYVSKVSYNAGQRSQQAKIDELQKELSKMTDRYILRGQEIDLLNRKIYDKNQIIEACLYSDDEDILKGNKDEK